jgi:D-psicose/D-tagatose/L-ribulose 3-epimerase
MKFGVNTLIWAESFTAELLPLLPRIKAAGFDGIECLILDPAQFAVHDLRRGLADNDLELTTCTVVPHDGNLISDDPAIRANGIEQMRVKIATVAEAGARMIAGPVFSPVGHLPGRRRTPEEWKRAVAAYHAISPSLVQHGVTLAIEPLNRFETYFLNTAADAAKLCAEVDHPNVGVLFDTFHANIEEKDISAGYRTVAPFLKHVHTCENDRGTPGSGHVEWDAVFRTLRDIHYDGWLTIESFGFALPNLSAAAAIWRDIEPSPDEIAFKGIEFLKRQTAS